MKEFQVKISSIGRSTHDVLRIRTEKPEGYRFSPGQATEVSIKGKDSLGKGPFTFTSLIEDPYIEFTIKIYTEHKSLTSAISEMAAGDYLIIRDPWGAITFNGPGSFIAAGAGVTPFIAIFRMLKKQNELEGNRLIFSNKTSRDIILEDEFQSILENDFINIITREKSSEHINGRLDKSLLRELITDFSQKFYICGPENFVEDIKTYLQNSGANPDSLVFEK